MGIYTTNPSLLRSIGRPIRAAWSMFARAMRTGVARRELLETKPPLDEPEKLKHWLECWELTRPTYLRPSVLLGFITALAAVYGVFWQYTTADLKIQKAELAEKTAINAQKDAKAEVEHARSELDGLKALNEAERRENSRLVASNTDLAEKIKEAQDVLAAVIETIDQATPGDADVVASIRNDLKNASFALSPKHNPSCCAYSPNGDVIATAGHDGRVVLWTPRGEPIREIRSDSAAITSIAWSPDGKLLATARSDSVVRLLSIDETSVDRMLLGHHYVVESVAFSPNGKLIATGAGDRTLMLWNSDGSSHGDPLPAGTAIVSLAFSPDSKLLASAGLDGTVRLWNIDNPSHDLTLTAIDSAAFSVAFSPDGSMIASGFGDGLVRLWNVDGTQRKEIFGQHKNPVQSIAFSEKGGLIAVAAIDGIVRLWKLDGTPMGGLSIGGNMSVACIAFSPDGHDIAVAGVGGLRVMPVYSFEVPDFGD